MKIQVLGTGCAKCRKLENHVRKAVEDLGVDADVEKVQDIDAIASFGVMMTPALAIDGQVKIVGKVPSVDDVKTLIAKAGE
ncbi:MAG: TM0996/MTH895 family glutaredoxin-like protein [Actinobacteria bacterium]|nr:TM0996/MTH895 family glutaredoxin-like protein [Actinomycetota bacterium]